MTTHFACPHQIRSRAIFRRTRRGVTVQFGVSFNDIANIAFAVGVILGTSGCSGDLGGDAPPRRESPRDMGAARPQGTQVSEARASVSFALGDENGRAMSGLRLCAYTYG